MIQASLKGLIMPLLHVEKQIFENYGRYSPRAVKIAINSDAKLKKALCVHSDECWYDSEVNRSLVYELDATYATQEILRTL